MLTLIIGRNFAHGRNWLRDNHKRLKLDPQSCRIVTESGCLKGLTDYEVYWLPGWQMSINADVIRHEAQFARTVGRLKKDHSA